MEIYQRCWNTIRITYNINKSGKAGFSSNKSINLYTIASRIELRAFQKLPMGSSWVVHHSIQGMALHIYSPFPVNTECTQLPAKTPDDNE